MQIPVTIPHGLSNQSINIITDQIKMYAQFLFSRVEQVEKQDVMVVPKQEVKHMSRQEARQYLDSLSIRGVNVPADINGMRDIVNTKYL